MSITSLCIKRPVTTLMFFLGLILLGVISYYLLAQELFPPLIYPQITILTTYEEASPSETESLITRPIEEAVGTVNRVRKVSSISREGNSVVITEFEWGTNMDFASLEIREKLDLIKEKLPKHAKEPIVMKFNPFEMPMMRVNLTGDVSPLKLRMIAKKDVKEELEKIEGVGAVEIVGGLKREIRVELEEARLRSASLSILDVTTSLEKSNLNYPAGTIKEPFFEFLVRTVGEFKTVDEIENLPVKTEFPIPEERLYYFKRMYEQKEKDEGISFSRTERIIFIKDLGKVLDTTKERESISRYQKKECVTLLIRRQSQTNIVLLSSKLKKELDEIKKKLPPSITVKIAHDEADFIKSSLQEVKNAAIIGGGLAFLVILFFLRNIWFSLDVIVSIPLCIVIVFLSMYLSKLSLNLISLGGLALGVGMLVDNGIVVLESIFVNPSVNSGKKVVQGTQEVGGAILGSTLTTVCVFLPMIFVVGIAGQLFKQLSFSVVFSLMASLIVAITLLPLLIYVRIKNNPPTQKKEIQITLWGEIFDFFFNHRFLTLIIVGVIFILGVCTFLNLDTELFPKVDQHEFIIKIEAPPGTPLEKTDEIVQNVEHILFNSPEIEEVTVNIGSSEEVKERTIQSQEPHQAQIFVKVNKTSPTSLIIKKLREKLEFLKKGNVIYSLLAQESFLKEALVQQAPLVLEIKGYDLQELKKIGLLLEEKLKTLPFLYNVKLDYPPPRPEVKVEIIKDKALLYNIYASLIAETVNVSLKGKVATKFKELGEEYDIKVILREDDREKVANLKRLIIHGFYQDRGVNVLLMELARVEKGEGPLEIKRVEGERTLLLSSSIYKTPLSKVLKEVKTNVLKGFSLTPGYRIKVGGEGENMKESFNSLRLALILGVILVFMVMASEFESLLQPFLILVTLPLSLIGVSMVLFFTHSTLNVISFLGLIMLGGIIVNNGIVLIDYTNVLRREKNLSLEEAIRLASTRRIRPILMTSLTTILGLLPLSLGKGTSLMQPLGLVTMGGLISGTFLTPVVLPILYYYLEKTLLSLHFRKPRREKVLETEIDEEEKPEELTIKKEVLVERKKVDINARQEKLIEYLKLHPHITRVEYAKLFDISVPTAARDLKYLLKINIIEVRGPLGPGRIYRLKHLTTDSVQ